MKISKFLKIQVIGFIIFLMTTVNLFSYPLEFKDSTGKTIILKKMPERIVSIVPSVTEAIFKLGAGDKVQGITYHSVYPSDVAYKKVVGGFFSPSVDAIRAMNPDMIFISDLHDEVVKAFQSTSCILINTGVESVEQSFDTLKQLGRIFNKEKEAEKIIAKNRDELLIIKNKTAKIKTKKRVMRLMGRDKVMTPGDDSFQNEVIKLAGCTPPETGKKGKIITLTLEEWKAFNPEVLYGCGDDRKVFDSLHTKSGWKEVDAVKNRRYLSFPCDLTCRASTNTGYFAGWLAAGVYPEAFGDKKQQVVEEKIILSEPVPVDLSYIKSAQVKRAYIHDFINKTLVIELKKPMSVVSTLEGYRENIERVGNHYFPVQTWGLGHSEGLIGLRKRTYAVLGLDEKNTSCLFTGADMDNLSVKTKSFKDMTVAALVTAGVRGNALKMSKDNGGYYEPGTINILIMSNMQLSHRAMTRAIISATEAKSAALADMDIRSSYSSLKHQATGTGTDNILVVEGEGTLINNAGGHSKMGELIAKAVYDGVKDAVFKQNGIIGKRTVYHRLKERKINVSGLGNITGCDCNIEKSELNAEIEKILLNPYYSGFLESAFAISDAHEKGVIGNIDFFKEQSDRIAKEISGNPELVIHNLVTQDDMPVILKTALNSIINGAVGRLELIN